MIPILVTSNTTTGKLYFSLLLFIFFLFNITCFKHYNTGANILNKQLSTNQMNNFQIKRYQRNRLTNLYSNINDDNTNLRSYAAFTIYKGKAALSIKPIAATFQMYGKQSQTVSREGGMLFEFAPIGNGPREYDWSKKTTFLLDATECGEIIANDAKFQKDGVEFSHDPNAQSDKSGQITKKLRINPTPDGKGYFISLNVNDRIASINSNILLPVTKAELEVTRQLMIYCLPYFLGKI